MRKIFVTFTILSLILNSFAIPVFAQTATDSAQNLISTPSAAESQVSTPSADMSVSSTAQVTASQDNQSDVNPFFEEQNIQDQTIVAPQLSLDGGSQTQPSLASPIGFAKTIVRQLNKKTYASNEKVDVTIANAKPDQISVSLADSNGNPVNSVNIAKTTNGITTDVILSSKLNFRPGKYTLSVTDSSGNTTTQDFTWGVLAINPNKSIYLPNETANLSMAVLDENGGMVCDSQVVLSITDPAGKVTNLTTQDKSITVNPQCLSHAFSLTPDYQASYQTGGEGNYSLNLTAATKNGTYSIDDSFQVSGSSPFDVERTTATRIYPPYSYPVTLKVTANQDFNGTAVEYVPSSFTISPYASGSASTVLSYDSTALPNQYTNLGNAFGVTSVSLSLPFNGDYVETQGFGVKMTDPQEAPYYASFGLAGHDGLDFAMPIGTPVLTADSGTVSLAGDGAYGTTIVVDHVWGKSYYGHLSKVEVTVGQTVSKGQEIGLSGNSGHTTGAHLHFGIKPQNPTMDNGYYGKVDPSPFLGLIATGEQVLGASTIASSADSKIIAWKLNVKKGDEFTLGYSFQTPPQSPQLYAIGPLSFFDSSKTLVFKEARKWQLAIDADQTAGPNNCGTAVDDSGVGTVAWTTPNNACTSGQDTPTASTLNSTIFSHYLKITNFGFSLPSDAVIKGIQFSINRWAPRNTNYNGIDNAVRAVKGGTIDSANDHSNASIWPIVSGTPQAYGTTSDLWGNSWLYSDINSSTFGVAISGKSNAGRTVTGHVSAYVTATITYNEPPGAPTGLTHSSISATSEQLTMSATDPGADTEEYKAILYAGSSDCSAGTNPIAGQTYDQTSSQTGWDNTSYASGATATLTTTSLTSGTTYYWKAAAIDPSGSNTWGTYSTCDSFTTSSTGGGPTLDQLLRHGKWFDSSGVRQPFTF